MRVTDIEAFLAALDDLMARNMTLLNDISRLMPAQATFDFATREEFEERASAVILEWASRICGKTFHIRLHRRGMGDKLSTPAEEKLLDTAVLNHLASQGHSGRISFTDPDCVIDIETVADRAGLSLWDRTQLKRFPFLRVE
jgi:tRNA(Ser,Leu) C12 N-acetylase TAN1